MRRWETWRDGLALIAAAILVVGGLNLLTFTSIRLLLLSVLLAGVGIVWFARVLTISARRQNRPWKRKLALLIVASSLSLFAFLVPALIVSVSSGRVADALRFDADLGWGGQLGDDIVGQRKDRIDPSRQHVLVVGDSILYGMGLETEETAAFRLGEALPDYQVLNLAVSGYSIDQYMLSLRHAVARTNPRLVIVGIYSGNDFEMTSREYGWGHSKPLFVDVDGQLVRTNPNLLEDSCIDRLARSLLFQVLWQDHDLAQRLIDHLCDARQLELDEAERAISLMFRAMDDEARAAGASILYVLLPEQRNFVDHAGQYPTAEMFYLTMYRRLRRLLEEGGHEFFEFAPDVAASGIPFEQLFLDQGHFLGSGHDLLAGALLREIRARHLLEESSNSSTQ